MLRFWMAMAVFVAVAFSNAMAGASPQEDATASGAQVAAESQAPAQVEAPAPASKPSKRVHYRNTRERWRGKPFIEDRNRALDFQLPTASGAFDGGFVR
jgi:hypothetical protein